MKTIWTENMRNRQAKGIKFPVLIALKTRHGQTKLKRKKLNFNWKQYILRYNNKVHKISTFRHSKRNKPIATGVYRKVSSSQTRLKTLSKKNSKSSFLQVTIMKISIFLIKSIFLSVFSMKTINRMDLDSFTVTTNQFVLIKLFKKDNKNRKTSKIP